MAITFWSILRGLFRRGSDDPASEVERLAGLLVLDIQLYNEELVKSLSATKPVPPELVAELSRAFSLLVSRTENLEMARSSFREQAVRVLGGGDPAVLHDALAQVTAGPVDRSGGSPF